MIGGGAYVQVSGLGHQVPGSGVQVRGQVQEIYLLSSAIDSVLYSVLNAALHAVLNSVLHPALRHR